MEGLNAVAPECCSPVSVVGRAGLTPVASIELSPATAPGYILASPTNGPLTDLRSQLEQSDRFATAAEFAHALSPTVTTPISSPMSVAAARTRRRIPALFAMLVLGVTIGQLAYEGDEPDLAYRFEGFGR